MRIAFLCKRQYMGKDVILDRYARLYEMPYQLAALGHEVLGCCLTYQSHEDGQWQHEVPGSGTLRWESRSLGALKIPAMVAYASTMRGRLQAFKPDIIIGASDIPHVSWGAHLARQLKVPYMADLYDNFEGFGQARIPGFVSALRRAVRQADLVTTTSAPLKRMVQEEYGASGEVVSMPSSVDLDVFHPGDKLTARQALGLPPDATLIGTAGGLNLDKGIEPLYDAWHNDLSRNTDLHLVLAGPHKNSPPPPAGDRVHYLGHLNHHQVADVFRALDVGIISILDTPFGRYCFPQKAYEMLACHLPVAAASVGEIRDLLADMPSALFKPDDSASLAKAVRFQVQNQRVANVPIRNWKALMGDIETHLSRLVVKAPH